MAVGINEPGGEDVAAAVERRFALARLECPDLDYAVVTDANLAGKTAGQFVNR